MKKKKQKRGKVAPVPNKDIRCDQIGHWPQFTEKRGRCKYPGCIGVPKIICVKCNIHLCLTPNSNCFIKFHNE